MVPFAVQILCYCQSLDPKLKGTFLLPLDCFCKAYIVRLKFVDTDYKRYQQVVLHGPQDLRHTKNNTGGQAQHPLHDLGKRTVFSRGDVVCDDRVESNMRVNDERCGKECIGDGVQRTCSKWGYGKWDQGDR